MRFIGYAVFAAAGILIGTAATATVAQDRPATEPTVMHVVAFTPTDGMTPQDLGELRRATETLVRSVPGMKRAWVGKLGRPVAADGETRTYGLILEFETWSAREAYSSHPARAAWAPAWNKVRKSGTIVDVMGNTE